MPLSNSLNTYWPATPLAVRRLKLTVGAFALIVVWLGTFYVIALLPSLLPWLAQITDQYGLYVRLTNAFLSLMCAAFLMWPAKAEKLVGGWNFYVGAAFFTFFVQYSLRSALLAWQGEAPVDPNDPLTIGADVLLFASSTLNNFFWLAAAKILLNKTGRLKTVQPPSDDAGKFQLVKHKLRIALPSWAWMLFLLSSVGALPPIPALHPVQLLARFPDGIFSMFCLSWFAYALYLCLYIRRGKHFARMAFVLVLAYGTGQLIYAANPVIAYAVGPDAPVSWLRDFLRFPLSDVATEVNPSKVLDEAIFAVLVPMKYLLFLPAFILYLISIISVNDFRQALQRTTSKRQDYLSRDGILHVIGMSLEATEVKLLVRIPGIRGPEDQTEEYALEETWRALRSSDKNEPRLLPIKDDPLLERTMQTEGEVIVITNEDDVDEAETLRMIGPVPQTLTLIPIKFHGGVIGVLRVIFSGYGKYNEGTLQQLKFMAELIAPSVQDFRTVYAVDKLGTSFERVQLEKPTDSFEHATKRMIETLFDLLNPLSIGVDIQWGFNSYRPIFVNDSLFYKVLETQVLPRVEKPDAVDDSDGRQVSVELDQLSGRTEKGEPYHLGTLMLAIWKDKDDFAEPTLAAYYLTRRMVASLTANGISNAARNSLGVLIEDLAVALNKETLSVEEWFATIDAAIKNSGLLWVVASLENETSLYGEKEHQQIISSLTPAEKQLLLAKPLNHIRLSSESKPPNIIHLQLENSEHRLFLGVARENFGPELKLQTPWKDFLQKLANVSGVALASIEDRKNTEVRRRREADERLKTAQDEWLKTIAVISAMLMHQLVNMVKDQLDTAEHLLEILPKDSNAQGGQLLTSHAAIKKSAEIIRDSAEMMQSLTNACTNLTKIAKHGSCSIQKAADQAASLFQFALRKQQIWIETNIPLGTTVQVQSNIVALALASLIGNAIDAIKAKGKIEIKAEVKGDVVLCHVINTGTRIPDHIIEKLFQPGITEKNGHNGWGLYLVKRSLLEFNGTISLDYSNSVETCFTLHLPNSSN